MLKNIMTTLLFCWNVTAFGQADQPTDSFQDYYQKKGIAIKYSFDSSKNIHDYSGNWDFDGDAKFDNLLFVSSGGAHAFYHPKIQLTSDNKVREFPILENDMPIFINAVNEKSISSLQQSFGFFIFTSGRRDELVFVIDPISFESSKRELRKSGLRTRLIKIRINTGKLYVRDL